ncbi:response regulator [Quatrionicoccus australiensis]|uniref:response regulator n=1 Tax=Quatrionicoccus australiensis TaxID=138118 RepID=UPI001CFAEA5A|nr:response regulator [Quatrionicoccus australiensis]MCB4361138.1 response regulator [Quatrionicoccus australiensis]
MSTGLRLFVVDDDPVLTEIFMATLEDDFQLETFASAEACLARLSEQKPDIFLLDVSLPGIDGCQLCRQLKDDWDTQDIPVLFVSGSDDIEARLLCYDAGGEDFISKPFDPNELLRKLRIAAQLINSRRQLHEQAGYAQRTAMSAMVSMGELGVVLQFLSKSFACESAAELAEAMLESMHQYDLQGAVQVRLGGEVFSLSENGRDLPLETSVLNHVSQAGRIFQFKSRCVFNYGRVTLMVNNMPLDDADRCGRIRDNGALLAEGADARLKAIEAELSAQRRRSGIEAALPRVHATLDAVQGNYRRNCYELTQVMIEFQEALMKSYVHLGLTEGQEEQMTAMAGDFMQRMVGTQDASLVIVGQLEELAHSLEGLVKA